MSFFTLNNIEINFTDYELNKSLYTIIEALQTIKRIKLMG